MSADRFRTAPFSCKGRAWYTEVIMRETLREDRLAKLRKALAKGIDPYPARARRSCTIGEALKKFSARAAAKKTVHLAGRIVSIRDQGGVLFADVRDQDGAIQAVLTKDRLQNFSLVQEVLDRGDFVSISGLLIKTKRGERSIEAKEISLLAKSLLPVPSERYGLEDMETRLRKRYLDLLIHPDARELFRKKALFWETLRSFLRKEEFLEVETPVLEAVPGGAEAEPFRTHMNALDADLSLRISLELPLKKLLVAGFEKVFEIGRVFRNEGIDREHLQDYTQLEFYWAYRDYKDCMKFVEQMYKAVIKRTVGGFSSVFGGKRIDWGEKWTVAGYVELFENANKMNPLSATRDELFKRAESLRLAPESYAGKGRLTDLIFKKTVRPDLIQPCFLVDPPVEIEPLAKRSRNDPRRAERFQVMACGTELGKGFSELNDPLDQRARFEEQMRLRAAGDREAQMLDEEYLTALEYGMPPAAGFGVSERLFAVLMDKPVRETVLFPLMRPKG